VIQRVYAHSPLLLTAIQAVRPFAETEHGDFLKVAISETNTNSRRTRCRAVSPINKAAKVTPCPYCRTPYTQVFWSAVIQCACALSPLLLTAIQAVRPFAETEHGDFLKVAISETNTNSRRTRCRAVSPINKAAKVTPCPYCRTPYHLPNSTDRSARQSMIRHGIRS